MSNAGKTVLNWRRDFPELRIALGLLGKKGYRSGKAAEFLLRQPETQRVRDFYWKVCSRHMQPEVLVSRMTKHREIENMETENPVAYRKGKVIYRKLAPLLAKAVGT